MHHNTEEAALVNLHLNVILQTHIAAAAAGCSTFGAPLGATSKNISTVYVFLPELTCYAKLAAV